MGEVRAHATAVGRGRTWSVAFEGDAPRYYVARFHRPPGEIADVFSPGTVRLPTDDADPADAARPALVCYDQRVGKDGDTTSGAAEFEGTYASNGAESNRYVLVFDNESKRFNLRRVEGELKELCPRRKRARGENDTSLSPSSSESSSTSSSSEDEKSESR